MSIDISWESLTGGSDGEALAEEIRTFIHERFQSVTLPKFINSVKVHSFDFGTVAPELELKDVCDPLPDFYEGDEESVSSAEEEAQSPLPELSPGVLGNELNADQPLPTPSDQTSPEFKRPNRPQLDTRMSSLQSIPMQESPTAPLSRSSTPAIPGGTSNMHSFHLPLSAGLSGAATPLVAFGGGPLPSSYHDLRRFSEQQSDRRGSHQLDGTSMSRDGDSRLYTAEDKMLLSRQRSLKERNVNDVQVVAQLKYAGDVKLSLTVEILLDYPMDQFVGIPLTLSVTGLDFDGVAILAYIKKKVHFCFLSPEDADALIGREDAQDSGSEDGEKERERKRHQRHVGGLFENIKVDSEIGQRGSGKQVLKNVDKVEKFVLEQVRSLFEAEFVYPSFWTFLV